MTLKKDFLRAMMAILFLGFVAIGWSVYYWASSGLEVADQKPQLNTIVQVLLESIETKENGLRLQIENIVKNQEKSFEVGQKAFDFTPEMKAIGLFEKKPANAWKKLWEFGLLNATHLRNDPRNSSKNVVPEIPFYRIVDKKGQFVLLGDKEKKSHLYYMAPFTLKDESGLSKNREVISVALIDRSFFIEIVQRTMGHQILVSLLDSHGRFVASNQKSKVGDLFPYFKEIDEARREGRIADTFEAGTSRGPEIFVFEKLLSTPLYVAVQASKANVSAIGKRVLFGLLICLFVVMPLVFILLQKWWTRFFSDYENIEMVAKELSVGGTNVALADPNVAGFAKLTNYLRAIHGQLKKSSLDQPIYAGASSPTTSHREISSASMEGNDQSVSVPPPIDRGRAVPVPEESRKIQKENSSEEKSVVNLIESAIDQLQDELLEYNVTFTKHFHCDGEIDGDSIRLEVAFVQLIRQAIQNTKISSETNLVLMTSQDENRVKVSAEVDGQLVQREDLILAMNNEDQDQTPTEMRLRLRSIKQILEDHKGSFYIYSGPLELATPGGQESPAVRYELVFDSVQNFQVLQVPQTERAPVSGPVSTPVEPPVAIATENEEVSFPPPPPIQVEPPAPVKMDEPIVLSENSKIIKIDVETSDDDFVEAAPNVPLPEIDSNEIQSSKPELVSTEDPSSELATSAVVPSTPPIQELVPETPVESPTPIVEPAPITPQQTSPTSDSSSSGLGNYFSFGGKKASPPPVAPPSPPTTPDAPAQIGVEERPLEIETTQNISSQETTVMSDEVLPADLNPDEMEFEFSLGAPSAENKGSSEVEASEDVVQFPPNPLSLLANKKIKPQGPPSEGPPDNSFSESSSIKTSNILGGELESNAMNGDEDWSVAETIPSIAPKSVSVNESSQVHANDLEEEPLFEVKIRKPKVRG